LPVPVRGTEQTASLVADLDANGMADIVIAERTSRPSVVWLRRTSRGWERQVIEPDQLPIEAGGAAHDIDADGDTDIVFGGDSRSAEVWWWENPGPDTNPSRRWQRRLIKASGSGKHHDQIIGDFNGDGRPELVFWNQRAKQLLWSEVPKDPHAPDPWPLTVIYEWTDGREHEGLAAMDIDGDGITDLVGGGSWYRREGDGRFSAHEIDPEMRSTRAAAGQLVAGGRPEIVFVPGDADGPAKWYQWNGKRWVPRVLEDKITHGHSLDIGDVDGDGRLDVFIAEMGRWGRAKSNRSARMLLLRGDGAGRFERTTIGIGFGNHESRLADLDGDGDLDILAKPYSWATPRVDVFLNGGTGGGSRASSLPLNKWRRHLIADLPEKAIFVSIGDLDGDGRRDIAAAGSWWRNPGEAEGKWVEEVFGASLHNVALLWDFDGDGDLDALGTEGIGATANARFVWARNGGAGEFEILNNPAPGRGDFLQGVTTPPLALGGSLGIALSWHRAGEGIQLLTVPRDPSAGSWGVRTLSEDAQDEDLSQGDIDGDGDQDLLLGNAWLENPGARGDDPWLWHALQWAPWEAPDRNCLADLDLDGRLDAVVGFEDGDDLVWYRSQMEPRGPWVRMLIASDVAGGFSMDCADLDRDGDVDVVLGEHRGNPNRVLVFENRNWGNEWIPHTIDSAPASEIDHHDGTQIADIDGDGDPDIVSLGWYNPRIWIYENLALP
jgi:hypothetical protein